MKVKIMRLGINITKEVAGEIEARDILFDIQSVLDPETRIMANLSSGIHLTPEQQAAINQKQGGLE